MWHLLSHLNIKKGIVTTKLLIPMCWARTAFLQSFKLQLHASWTTFTERMICSDQPYLMGSSLLELKILILSKVNTSDFGSIHTAEAPLGWHIYDVAKNGLTSRHKMQNYYKIGNSLVRIYFLVCSVVRIVTQLFSCCELMPTADCSAGLPTSELS